MKRLKCLIVVLLAAVFLSGCVDMINYASDLLVTTSDYRLYDSFVSRHDPGMSKQKVMDKLGCPYAYTDAQGKGHCISYDQKDTMEETLLEDGSIRWYYECYKYRDPSDPYRLVITFDGKGRTVSAELDAVPGG